MKKIHFVCEKYSDDMIEINMVKQKVYHLSELQDLDNMDGDIFVYYPKDLNVDFLLADGSELKINYLEKNSEAKEQVLKNEMPRRFKDPIVEAVYTNTLYREMSDAIDEIIDEMDSRTINDSYSIHSILNKILSKIDNAFVCCVTQLNSDNEEILVDNIDAFRIQLLHYTAENASNMEEISKYNFYTNNGYKISIKANNEVELEKVADHCNGVDLKL